MASKSPKVCPYSFVSIKYSIKKDNIEKIIAGGQGGWLWHGPWINGCGQFFLFFLVWPLLSTGTPLLPLTDFWTFSIKAVSQLIIFAHLPAFSPFSLFLSTSPPSPAISFFLLLWHSGFHNLNWEWWEFPTAVRLDPFYQEKWQARGVETRVWAWGQHGAGMLPGPLLTQTVLFCVSQHRGIEMECIGPRTLKYFH